MQLNIKDAETCAMIGELAEVTGTTKAGIVKELARERLDRIAAEREADIAAPPCRAASIDRADPREDAQAAADTTGTR